ncbi:putative transcription factor WD40-like family [Helianthus annuus]|nr:putative transcription factor WD40-like family [Helianthus annuus]
MGIFFIQPILYQEFDRDDELFATARVSRRIKVFEFASMSYSGDAKLSCLSWNKNTKNHIASSDYEGIVTVWDVNTCQYEEHEKRAWSVDFSRTEPTILLVSGSDDCKVLSFWWGCKDLVYQARDKCYICSVKYNPGSSYHVAVSGFCIRYYDLRNISQPSHRFSGHRKAVSYVKLSPTLSLLPHLPTAHYACGTLRKMCLYILPVLRVRTFRGHTNEKNFVGLSVNNEYIACRSESNEVFVYHKVGEGEIYERLLLRLLT